MDILNKKGVKTQRIKGTVYVYTDTPYWDSNKKQNRHKRNYIGKLGANGEFIPNKNYQTLQSNKEKVSKAPVPPPPFAERRFFGVTHLLDCIGEQLRIFQDLVTVFGEIKARKLLSLAYFIILESESSMYRFEKFAKTHSHPFGQNIPSQRISEIFADISEADKMAFFKLRTEYCCKDEYLAYDTTSISSYSEMMNMVKYGKNKDLEDLPQINLALVFGEQSLSPVYYRKLPGNISDVSTLNKLLIDMSFVGITGAKFVLDRGFYSKDNINFLFSNKHKFIVACRANTKLYKDFLSELQAQVKGFDNYIEEHGVYGITKKATWEHEYENRQGKKVSQNRVIYLHGFYDGERAEKEKTDFIKKLRKAEKCFREGDASCEQEGLVKSFFFLKEVSKDVFAIVRANQEAIDMHLAKFGYFILVSNHIKSASMALKLYRNKDVVEKAFCNIKQRLDMKRTNVSSEEALEGKLFVQFLALTFLSHVHKVMSASGLYKNYSTASLLDEIDVIEIYKHGDNSNYSEITDKQRTIFSHFDIAL